MRSIAIAVVLILGLVGGKTSAADKAPPTTSQGLIGGYAKAEITKQEVKDAAAFAIQAQAKVLL